VRPLHDQLAFALEIWADEDAAHVVADCSLTARSLARAALVGTGASPVTALGYLRHHVTARVRALQATGRKPAGAPPCSPDRWWP
jgi:hypothetical protein